MPVNTTGLKNYFFPPEMRQQLSKDTAWSDDSFETLPFFITVFISPPHTVWYQLYFNSNDEAFGGVNLILTSYNLECSGEVWLKLLLKFFETQNKELTRLIVDYEKAMCSLAISDEEDFMKLKKCVAEFFENDECIHTTINELYGPDRMH